MELEKELRQYQLALFQQAFKENSIIFLPTGSGKTMIAIMLLQAMSKQLIGTLEEGGKRSIFICNTITLAQQQFEVLQKTTNFKCGILTSEQNIDSWKKDNWLNEFNSKQVFVATCQVIVDIIKFNYIQLCNINLLIFDECHHANGDHPMSQLMKQFQFAHQQDLPRVVGLTATLLKTSSKESFFDDLEKLESIFRAKIVTVSNIDDYHNVLLYATSPQEMLVKFNNKTKDLNVCQKIVSLIEDCIKRIDKSVDISQLKRSKGLATLRPINPIQKIILLLKDFLFQLDYLGLYGSTYAILSVIIELELKKLSAETSKLKALIRMSISVCERIQHMIANYLRMTKENKLEQLFSHSSSRICTFLLFVLEEFKNKKKEDIKCLAFVNRRYTAKCLHYLLLELIEYDNTLQIVPDFITGFNSAINHSIESILRQNVNSRVLEDFKNNKTNFLIASSVLEEGIDVQSCNYVVRIDEPQTFASYVQSKGRARQKNSYFCIIVDQAYESKTLAKLSNYREMDKMLKDHLVLKTLDKPVKLTFNSNEDCKGDFEPYITVVGARVDISSSLTLLYRYLTHLFTDRFSVSSLIWNVTNLKDDYKMVELHLPMQSTIKHIIYSQPLVNVQVGKKLTALDAIKLLHKNGELNDRLLPVSNEECIATVNPKYFEHWENYKDDKPSIAGTKKMRRLHNIRIPSELIDAFPIINKPCYLYNINIVPLDEMKIEDEFIYSLLVTNSNYAILTLKNIPKIAKMPLFMSQGEVLAEILSKPISTVIHSTEDLDALRKFHLMIFRDLLGIWKSFFAYDNQKHLNSFLIVPMKNGEIIDWELVKSFPKLTKMCAPTPTEQKSNVYDANDYVGKIISTWYSIEETHYAVKKISPNQTPLSDFPNDSLNCTFADYYKSRYTVDVMHLGQNLIEVQPLTSRLNFIQPGTVKKNRRFKNEILLIPELCHNFMFPSDMWLKAMFLPTILHRLHFLLHAENLRVKINKIFNIKCTSLPKTLIVDNSLPRVHGTEEKREPKEFQFPSTSEVIQTPKIIKKKPVSEDLVWEQHKLPKDFEHDMKKLYAAEIYYYHNYTKGNLKDSQTQNVNSEPLINERLPALEDVSHKEKMKINILEITLDQTDLIGAEQSELLAALTSANASDVFDMERVEVLGDAFLKFHISLFVYHNHDTWNEGYLTSVKGKFVSNQNLLYCVNDFSLPAMLNATPFEPRGEWLPPLVSVPDNVATMLNDNQLSSKLLYCLQLTDSEIKNGKCDDGNLNSLYLNFKTVKDNVMDSELNRFINKQSISDKTCADAIEALIGVCVKNYGIERTFKIIEHLGILPKGSSKQNLLKSQFPNPRIKSNVSDSDIDSLLINYESIEKTLNYKFKDRAFLLQALTHPSFAFNRITGCYQQLEFIGDAILDFLISCYIFERCKEMNPGKLTDLRSALVNNCTLATISVRNKFHLHMKSNNVPLQEATIKFDDFLKTQNYFVTDNVRILHNEKEVENNEFIADYVDVPKALGDIFESIIGAIFFDSGNDLNVTWCVIYRLMAFEIHQFIAKTPIQLVRQLMEHKTANATFDAPCVLNNVYMVKCTFQCANQMNTVNGFGKNTSEAKQSAAKLALRVLNYG